MRVRITQRLQGRIEGIRLSQFETGRIYDLAPELACYLIVTDAGVSEIEQGPEPPLSDQGIDRLLHPVIDFEQAADTAPRRARHRRPSSSAPRLRKAL